MGAHLQIEQDFPATARAALLHLLYDLVEHEYVGGWIDLARELQRIERSRPVSYDTTSSDDRRSAQATAEESVLTMPWQKVYDFCERLHSFLAREVGRWNSFIEEYEIITPKGEVQDYIANEIKRLFLEESLAVEFNDGLVQRRGRRHTTAQVSRAELVLGDRRFESARKHYNKALHYFRSVANPDPENVVKEAVCAVEAVARVLFGTVKAKTLGVVIQTITGDGSGKLPKSIAQTFHGVYGFRSAGDGVGHGGTTGGQATREIAEYILALSASQIILLVDLANAQDNDIPF